MTGEELMIGDWLYYKGMFNAFPFQVEQITKKKVGYHPIPAIWNRVCLTLCLEIIVNN